MSSSQTSKKSQALAYLREFSRAACKIETIKSVVVKNLMPAQAKKLQTCFAVLIANRYTLEVLEQKQKSALEKLALSQKHALYCTMWDLQHYLMEWRYDRTLLREKRVRWIEKMFKANIEKTVFAYKLLCFKSQQIDSAIGRKSLAIDRLKSCQYSKTDKAFAALIANYTQTKFTNESEAIFLTKVVCKIENTNTVSCYLCWAKLKANKKSALTTQGSKNSAIKKIATVADAQLAEAYGRLANNSSVQAQTKKILNDRKLELEDAKTKLLRRLFNMNTFKVGNSFRS
jgi:hypothetical protein